MFFMFFIVYVFLCFFNVVFLLLLKHKRTKFNADCIVWLVTLLLLDILHFLDRASFL